MGSGPQPEGKNSTEWPEGDRDSDVSVRDGDPVSSAWGDRTFEDLFRAGTVTTSVEPGGFDRGIGAAQLEKHGRDAAQREQEHRHHGTDPQRRFHGRAPRVGGANRLPLS